MGFSWGYVYFMFVKPRDFRNLPFCREGTYARAVAGGQHVSLVSNHRVTLATTTPRRACRDRQLEYSSVATTNVIPILRSPPVCLPSRLPTGGYMLRRAVFRFSCFMPRVYTGQSSLGDLCHTQQQLYSRGYFILVSVGGTGWGLELDRVRVRDTKPPYLCYNHG